MRVGFENLPGSVRRSVVYCVNMKTRVVLGKHARERTREAGFRVIARYDYVYFFSPLEMSVGLHCCRELLSSRS